MAKFFTIKEDKVRYLSLLMERKNPNEFVVLSEYNEFVDICQYSEKYQNLHIISVPSGRLDWSKRLA